MTAPQQAAPAKLPEREPQTAVAPLNTIAPEDIGAGAAAFDKWLREISHDYVTLARLSSVAGSLPVIGNIMALIDVIMDVVRVVQKFIKKEVVEFLEWVSMGVNLIGVIPLPPAMGAARMSLRPALHLVKQKLATGIKDAIGAALIEVLVTHLNDKIAGEIETFVQGATAKLGEVLQSCASLTDSIIDDLISILKRCIGKEPLFKVAPAVPEKALHNPEVQSSWSRMLAALDRKTKQVANYAASVAASHLPDVAVAGVEDVIAKLTKTKGDFRGTLTSLADAGKVMGIMWMLLRLLDAVRQHKKTRSAVVPANKGAQVTQNKPGHTLEATGHQAPAKGECKTCKNAPAPSGTGNSISFATGCETLMHTDFVLAAPLPIDWSRTYRSNLGAYDQGNLGARWLTPYSSRVDVVGKGKKQTGLIYHGSDGRSHRYPLLRVGQSHRDAVEEITLIRMSETLLTLDFGKAMPEGKAGAWRESYELVDTVASKAETQGQQHFRLVAIHAQNGAAIGLRYDHVIAQGPHAGEQVLSDILSKQGEDTLAHVGTQVDAQSGLIRGLWEIKDGTLVRQLAAYEYSDQGDLITAQEENAATWNYQYQNHLVTRYSDRTGRGMNLQYDGTDVKAKAIREWADDGSFDTRLEWDKNIRLTYVTDALGGETWYYYDIDGYTYRTIHPDQREEWFFRDDAKNVTRHIRPDGSTDDYRYDKDGNLQNQVRADGSQVHFEYDKLNRLTGVLDAEGGVWKRDYDAQGHLVEETDPRGHKTGYAYDKVGRPIEITDAKGGTKKLSYTESGQLASYTDCSGNTSEWAYDARGRLVKGTDAAGNETKYRYTPVSAETLTKAQTTGNHPGQLEAVMRADGNEEHLRHDAEGRLLAHTDALQRTTAYSYTQAGLIQQRTDALGQRLGYQWDKLGRLSELRNENGRPYSFQYDPVGRLLQERGFDDKFTEYHYDEGTGVLAEVIEGELHTQLEFDPMGRLIQRKATAPGQPEQTESFGYNANGRLAQASNEHAKLQWFYDEAGNLVREHQHYQGPLHPEKRTAVWHHRYDELNQRVGTTRPGGHTTEWLTYGSGHVHGLVLDGQDIVGFERDELHREVKREQSNGLAQSQKYDPVGRLLEQQLSTKQTGPAEMGVGAFKYIPQHRTTGDTPAAVLRQYRYDKAGQLSSIGDSRRGQIDYRYDPVGRLLKATSALAHETFAFDPAGNIAVPGKESGERAPGLFADPQRTQPTGNKLLDNLLKDYAGTSYKYDERGNLIERVHNGQRSEFAWDAFNRMTRAVTPQGTTTFAYDPLGRRVAKHSQTTQGMTQTLFGWDGDTLAFESSEVKGHTPSAQTVHYIHEAGSFVPLVQLRRSEAIKLQPTTDVKALRAGNGGKYDVERDPLWNGQLEEEPEPFQQEEPLPVRYPARLRRDICSEFRA